MPDPTTHTLAVPRAVLTYDVRRAEGSTEPALLLIGSPMGAAGFGTLATHFPDRTLVTYDPRGVERSTVEWDAEPTRDQHADDLHRLIEVVGGPVDVFASSGGAINALWLVAAHPTDVRTLVAHEPPIVEVLPDRDAAHAANRAVYETYQRSGFGAGMAHFIALVTHTGEFPDDWASRPAPDPATFGLPTEDDGSRDDPLLGSDPDGGSPDLPDVDAVRVAQTRVIVAAGETNVGELTNRAAVETAKRLGSEVVRFPSHHAGFLGGEYGQTGEPEAFAARLREVLDQA
jgi:pimeloyl-ACP methyl ester carboxylesterase